MNNLENTQVYPIFKAIFQDKHVQPSYFSQNFQCNELDNTITKTTNISNYCDDFNQWFSQVNNIDIQHIIGEEKQNIGDIVFARAKCDSYLPPIRFIQILIDGLFNFDLLAC